MSAYRRFPPSCHWHQLPFQRELASWSARCARAVALLFRPVSEFFARETHSCKEVVSVRSLGIFIQTIRFGYGIVIFRRQKGAKNRRNIGQKYCDPLRQQHTQFIPRAGQQGRCYCCKPLFCLLSTRRYIY